MHLITYASIINLKVLQYASIINLKVLQYQTLNDSFYRILLLSGDISLNPGPKNNLQPLDSK